MKRIKAAFLAWLVLTGLIYVMNGSKAAAAMFIVALVYCVLAFAAVMISGRKLKPRIVIGSGADKNKESKVVLSAESGSKIPVPSCRIDIACENVLTKEKETVTEELLPGLKGKDSTELSVTSPYCGMIGISAEDAVISDPVGLFSRKQKMSAGTELYVMPEISEVGIPEDFLDSYDMESYTYSQYRKGSDPGEVFGIREYQDGDSPKQIHWKLSAKLDDMIVKIPSYPIENKLIILLDNSIPEGAELSAEERSGLMEYFFSISHILIGKNITHSLGWCDHRSGSFIVRRVESDGDMWAAVPEALSAGIEQSGMSTAYRFLSASGDEHFTNHFIVTCFDPRDTEMLAEYGEVRTFRKQQKAEHIN